MQFVFLLTKKNWTWKKINIFCLKKEFAETESIA